MTSALIILGIIFIYFLTRKLFADDEKGMNALLKAVGQDPDTAKRMNELIPVMNKYLPNPKQACAAASLTALLEQHPEKTKVGFALKLDDLPENYKYKYDIIRFESFYWEKRMQYKFPIYDAPIDTTFAL